MPAFNKETALYGLIRIALFPFQWMPYSWIQAIGRVMGSAIFIAPPNIGSGRSAISSCQRSRFNQRRAHPDQQGILSKPSHRMSRIPAPKPGKAALFRHLLRKSGGGRKLTAKRPGDRLFLRPSIQLGNPLSRRDEPDERDCCRQTDSEQKLYR